MLLDHNYPTDQRVENEARSLANAGFKVIVLSIGKDERALEEDFEGTKIIRVGMPIWLRQKLRGAVGFLNIYSHIIAFFASRVFQKYPFDAVHAHDLYLGKAGIILKEKYNIPLTLDLHENYVEALSEYAWSSRFPGNLFISINKWKTLEKNWLNKADLIVTVIKEMKEKYINEGIPEEKLIITPNTPDIISFRAFDVQDQIISKFKDRQVLLYSGGFDLHRGLSVAIDAMELVKEKHADSLLLLVGDGRNREELETQVKNKGLSDYVVFEGWQLQDTIRSYVRGADIGLIPHIRSVQTDASIPHKLGYYMSEKLPVITSNCTSLERMVTDYNAGKVFESGNSKDLAKQIIYLLSNKEEAIQLGINGKVAAEKDFNWNATVLPLVDYYRSISAK